MTFELTKIDTAARTITLLARPESPGEREVIEGRYDDKLLDIFGESCVDSPTHADYTAAVTGKGTVTVTLAK